MPMTRLDIVDHVQGTVLECIQMDFGRIARSNKDAGDALPGLRRMIESLQIWTGSLEKAIEAERQKSIEAFDKDSLVLA